MPSQQISAAAARLQAALDLPLAPVAVSFSDQSPETVTAPSKPVPAGCVFWQQGAEAAVVTTAKDHALCAIGVHTHNLADPVPSQGAELGAVLGVLGQMTYVRPEDIPGIPTLASQPRYVVYQPLAGASSADVVLLLARNRQSLVLSEATSQVDGAIAPAMGRPACAVVPQAVNSGNAAMTFGCCGARAYLDTFADDIAIWALPAAKLDAYTERIEKIAEANRVLTQFHRLRGADVAAGATPTYAESLTRMG